MKKTIKTMFINNGEKTLVHFNGLTSYKEENSILINWCKENNISFAGIDFPAQGETLIDDKDKPTIEYLVSIGVSFVRSLNKKDLIISGHSIGGMIAILVGNIIGKESVSKIIVENPVNPSFLENEEQRLKLLNTLKEKNQYSKTEDGNPKLIEMDAKTKQWYKDLSTSMLDYQNLEKLKTTIEKSEIYTYIISSKEDDVIPHIESLKYFKSIRNDKINFIEIENANHSIHNTNEYEYIQAFDKYIKAGE